MHKIKVYHHGTIIVPTDKSIAIGTPIGLIAEAWENKKRILEGAASVESCIETIIFKHFFPSESDLAKDFNLIILRSDWFSFAAKRKVLGWIVEIRQLIEGSEKERYVKLLKDTMSYRNAFAHGNFESDGEKVFLSYFEGSPRKKELSDDYLKKIESTLLDAVNKTQELSVKSGATSKSEKLQVPESCLVPDPESKNK